MKYAIAFSAAAAVALSAAFANHHEGMGHEGMEKGDDAAMKARMEAHFKEVDANADGKVSEQEFLDYVTAKAKAQFASMAGDDNTLTMAEMEAHHDAMKAGMKKEHGEHEMEEHKSGEH